MPLTRCYPSSASTSLADLLAGPTRSGTVFAAVPAASYVSVPDEDAGEVVLALLAPAAVRLPIGLRVTEGPLPAQGTPVEVGGGLVASPGRAWRPVRWWDPCAHLHADALLAHADVLADVVDDEPAGAYGLPLAEALAVAAALANGDGGAVAAVADVVGLGPGLTPAGDDVVAGAFAVLATVGRLADPVRTAVAAYVRTRTTALSSALVAAAGRGEMIPQAVRLLTSVAAGESRDQVASAARSLFAVGSTSGHDLAAGMAGALRGAA